MSKHNDYFDHVNVDEGHDSASDKEKQNEEKQNEMDQEKMHQEIVDKIYDIIVHYRNLEPIYNFIYTSDLLKRPSKYYKINTRLTPVTNALINEIIDCVNDNVFRLFKNKDYFYYLTVREAILANIINKLKMSYVDSIVLP